jgi:hypothetical protein
MGYDGRSGIRTYRGKSENDAVARFAGFQTSQRAVSTWPEATK